MIQTNKLLTFFFIKASSKRFIGGVCSRQIDNIFTNFKKKKKSVGVCMTNAPAVTCCYLEQMCSISQTTYSSVIQGLVND